MLVLFTFRYLAMGNRYRVYLRKVKILFFDVVENNNPRLITTIYISEPKLIGDKEFNNLSETKNKEREKTYVRHDAFHFIW